jgi:hypothetical protein
MDFGDFGESPSSPMHFEHELKGSLVGSDDRPRRARISLLETVGVWFVVAAFFAVAGMVAIADEGWWKIFGDGTPAVRHVPHHSPHLATPFSLWLSDLEIKIN